MFSIIGWHGSHRWDGLPEIQPPRRGRYEHGCGIYLTTDWSRARDYAKGGGSIQRMTVVFEHLPERKLLPMSEIEQFIMSCPGLRRRRLILERLSESAQDRIAPNYVNNIVTEAQALTAASAAPFAAWLSWHGMPYEISPIVPKGAGREEWMVIFDPRIIKSAETFNQKEYDKTRMALPLFSEQIQLQARPHKPIAGGMGL